MSLYDTIPIQQKIALQRHLYGAIINLLYQKDADSNCLDNSIQTVINQINGANELFGFQPEILSILCCLENARSVPEQFRKSVLDAANLVNVLKVGDE